MQEIVDAFERLFSLWKFYLIQYIAMKTILLLTLVAALIYYCYPDSASPTRRAIKPVAVEPVSQPAHTESVVVSAPSYHERWKTGPNAQTNLKVGRDAQTHFEPFAPSEHATWNQGSPGYTIVAGARMPRR